MFELPTTWCPGRGWAVTSTTIAKGNTLLQKTTSKSISSNTSPRKQSKTSKIQGVHWSMDGVLCELICFLVQVFFSVVWKPFKSAPKNKKTLQMISMGVGWGAIFLASIDIAFDLANCQGLGITMVTGGVGSGTWRSQISGSLGHGWFGRALNVELWYTTKASW